MKQLKTFLAAVLMLCCATLSAHDFEVEGIFYNILSKENKTVEVKGPNFLNYDSELTIPANVTYNGTTYNVTTIGEGAFDSCIGLTSIEIPYSVTTIGNSAFNNCTSLTSVTIPNSVTTIGDYAFRDCSGLTSVTIGNSVTTIGEGAFFGCEGLTSVTIGNSVTTIGDYAFISCTILTSIEISNSVTTIGEGAFIWCSGLTSITIGNSVTTIGDMAFDGCEGLTSITSLIPADKLFTPGTDAFYDCNNNYCTLYVPNGAKATYQATDGWSDFENIVELEVKSFDLSVSAAGYATLYLDFNATIPEGVEVYTANSVEGNKLMMQQVTGVLPANTGVIVRAAEGSYQFVESDENVAAIEGNLLQGSVETVDITPETNKKYYVLAKKNGVVGMYVDALSGGIFRNNANKAYLVLDMSLDMSDEGVNTQNPGTQLSNKYYFDFSGTTVVEDVITESEGNVYYDLSGRAVENLARGIYIVNGKKVFIK